MRKLRFREVWFAIDSRLITQLEFRHSDSSQATILLILCAGLEASRTALQGLFTLTPPSHFLQAIHQQPGVVGSQSWRSFLRYYFSHSAVASWEVSRLFLSDAHKEHDLN